MSGKRAGNVRTARRDTASRLLQLAAGTIALLLGGMTITAAAEADRAFAPRFSQNVQGAITFTANTVMTCPASDSRCPAAQAGTGSTLNNNSFTMGYVDIDSDPSTFDSSSAQLTVPDPATVLFAGLYYGGQTTAGTGGQRAPNAGARGSVLIKVPGSASYQTLTASVDDSTTGKYVAFVDVTSLVASARSGSYAVANIQTGTGQDRAGGWTLVVAYRDSDEPARNLTVFDGLETVGQGDVKTIGVSGFQTPASGQVKTQVGFSTFEGDLGLTGDSASLNGRVLSSATNPANNFFNSSISRDGVPLTEKDPDYVNQLGFDATQVNADGILANGATSAAIRLQTTKDQYLPFMVSFATELFSPDVRVTKSVANLTNPGGVTRSGDTLRYTVTYSNVGGDGAAQFVAEDVIPANTTYLPGSLEVTAGPNAPSSPTDAIGDDVGEFLPDANAVRFRLGQGASATRGGLLPVTGVNSATVTFETVVGSGLPSGTVISNEAVARFQSETLNTALTAESDPVLTTVQAPDLKMFKSHVNPSPGDTSIDFTLGVTNVGGLPTDGSTVTVTDTFPSSAFSGITPGAASGWSCLTSGGPPALTLTCTRSDALPAGSSYPNIPVTATLVGSPPAEFDNQAEVAGGGDTNLGNNLALDFLPIPPPTADLQLNKTVSPGTIATGGRVTYTLVARNNGPFTATGVTVGDLLPAGLTGVTATPSQGSCPTVSTGLVICSLGSIPSGGSATMEVSAEVTTNDTTLTNDAEVVGDQADPYPANNEAIATLEVAKSANVTIEKSAGPNPTAGEAFSYTLSATNQGPSPASDVVVNEVIPELFSPTSVVAPGFSCGALPPAGGELTCVRQGNLPVGQAATVTINGTLSPDSAGVPVINTATVSSAEGRSDPEGGSSSTTIVPVPFADLSVGKVASKNKVEPGDSFKYTLTVDNRGPVAADPVRVVDTLGNGLEVRELPSSCTQKGQKVTCDLGKLGVGKTRTLVIKVRARSGIAGKKAVNTVRVSAPQPDPVPAGNSDSWSTPVGGEKVKARVIQKVPSKKIRSGRNAKLKIVVKNPSNRAITNAKVCQELPGQLVPVKVKQGGLASKSRGKVCWKIGTLPAGKSENFWVTVRAISKKPTKVKVDAVLSGGNAADDSDAGKVRIGPGSPPDPYPVTG